MSPPPPENGNRTIWVLAEGDTERAAGSHLKQFLDSRAGGLPRVRLRTIRQHGPLLEKNVRGQAQEALRDPSTVGVIALTDVHPKFKDANHARLEIKGWLPDDGRCHVHVARHDFEAWLLVGWPAILKQAGVGNKQPWGKHPEEINTAKPPAHRMAELFHQGRPPRKYKKPIDGKKLFEKLDVLEIAAACPEFKAFLNCLLSLAGYPPVP